MASLITQSCTPLRPATFQDTDTISMSSNLDNSKPAKSKTTLQQSPGRLVKLIVLLVAGIVLAGVAMYVFPTSKLVSILLWTYIVLSVLVLPVLLYWYLEPEQSETKPTPRKDVIDIFIKIASSGLFILSLVVAWKSFEDTSRQTARNLKLAEIALENNRAEQRSRRFTDALERLGGDAPSKRLTGIFAFTHLDSEIESTADFTKESATAPADEREKLDKQRAKEEAEHWAIITILTSHIQQYSPAPKDVRTKARKPTDERLNDINEILQYLGTRKLTFETGELKRVNFKGADLTGYFKSKVPDKCNELSCNPDCNKTNFEGADFTGARLNRAEFQGVKLRKAIFNDADLTEAYFDCADLTDAEFRNTNISGADLSRAKLNRDDQLSAAFGDAETKCPTSLAFDADAGTCVKKQPAVQ